MAKKPRRRAPAPVAVAPTDERETVTISKIANGYLIEKSGYKRGKYTSHREYSASKPIVAASVVKAPVAKARAEHRSPRAAGAPREVGFLKGQ